MKPKKLTEEKKSSEEEKKELREKEKTENEGREIENEKKKNVKLQWQLQLLKLQHKKLQEQYQQQLQQQKLSQLQLQCQQQPQHAPIQVVIGDQERWSNRPCVRAGLVATYSGMNQEMLDQCDAAQYSSLIYTVSFLHTVVQQRRKFGPLGWNIPYEFNSADWLASCIFMNNHLNDYDPKRGISWPTVRYMIGEAQYGGRVTDDYDKRLLNTFAKVWFSDSLFSEDFAFYKGYDVLNFKQVTDYLEAIEAMPAVDPPQVYGLHSNADITYQSFTTRDVLDTIISVQPKEVSGGIGRESREASVVRQIEEMLGKLPPLYNPFEVKNSGAMKLRKHAHTEFVEDLLRINSVRGAMKSHQNTSYLVQYPDANVTSEDLALIS